MSDPIQKGEKSSTSDDNEFDQPLLRSLAWTGSIRWVCQIITWTFTLIVARILTPEDYGLMAIALIYLQLITLFSEFGLGKAVVVLRDITRQQVAQINGLALLLGLTGLAVSWFGAQPASLLFFDQPDQALKLKEMIQVLSITFVMGALRTVPFALLEKDLKFKAIALIDAARTLGTALTTLILAYLGYGYWSLVGGVVMESVIASSCGLALRRHSFALPRLNQVQSIVQVSWHFLVDISSYMFYKAADQLIAGKILGAIPLGAYTLANQFAHVPVDKITAVVSRVTPAFFAAVSQDRDSLRRYLLALTRGLALITLPLTFGIALVAEEFVLVVLGEKWQAMVIPMQLLSMSAAFQGVYTILPRVLWATGNTRFSMWISLLTAVCLSVAFYIGSSWGIAGIAAAWLVGYPIPQVPVIWLVFRKINLNLITYLAAWWPGLSSSLLMAVAILGLDKILPDGLAMAFILAAKIITGGIAYGLSILLLHRSTALKTMDTFRQLRTRKIA